MFEIPEPDYDDPKEALAFFGLAAYYAQCVEESIIILVAILNVMQPDRAKLTSYDDYLARLDKRTLGKLINEDLKKTIQVDLGLQSRLEGLLVKRNYLVHHFFEKHSLKMLSKAGTRETIDELYELARTFREGDRILVETYEPLFEKMGVGRDLIEQELERMKRDDC